MVTIKKLYNEEYGKMSYLVRLFGKGFIFRPWVPGVLRYERKHRIPRTEDSILKIFKTWKGR